MNRRRVHAAAIALICMLGACSAPSDSLAPVVLPDLSPLAESVQRQLRDRSARLTNQLESMTATPAEKASAYGDLGRLLMAAKLTDEAVICFRHAEALDQREMRWPYYLAHAYLRKGKRAEAIAALTRASALRPDDATVLIWLGETYLDDSQPDAADSFFRKALAVQPQSAPALFGAGRAALARQAYSDAAQLLERALLADSKASAVHYPLAMAYRGLGDRDKAQAQLRQRGSTYPALIDPLMQPDEDLLDSTVAHENNGMQALRSGDLAAAESAFRKGLELDRDDETLRYWLGATLYASGDTAAAEREFQEVIKKSPGFANAHFSLGMIALARGQRSAAIEHLRSAVTSDPKLPEARLRLAETLRASGQLQAALPEYEAAVGLDPAIAEAWTGGAQTLIALGRRKEADEWMAKAQRIHPDLSR